MNYNVSLENTINESFSQYAGAVIQSRALVDVRDCVKPSARQIYYCLYTDGFTANKPFKKTLKAIGSAMRMYIHGDSSCEGIIMRSGQPFSLRYPLIEVEGSYGNLTESGNWAASRYTSARLSPLADYLLQDTSHHSIDEWVDNYDDTEQYPRVLSSLGFYNIVNGSFGIAVGLASSIPQFNLAEVNNTLIKLLKAEDPRALDDKNLICFPDFATGGTIINQDEVEHSLIKGTGKPCIIQAKIEYNKKDHCLIVTELPFGVYTNTICTELEKLSQKDDKFGIVRINDLTGKDVCIKLYLAKTVKPEAMIDFLYANTSLQSSYSINLTMLKNGRQPHVYSWKEALIEHLEHEKSTYIKCYTHQLEELRHKLKIIEGIIAAIEHINEVIKTIKESDSTKKANLSLQKLLDIDEEQAKAILDMKLSRLTKLEISDFQKKKEDIFKQIVEIGAILNDEKLLKKQMIKRFQEVVKKFGDERRTQVIQKTIVTKTTSNRKAPTIENVVVALTANGYIKSIPVAKFRPNGSVREERTTTNKTINLFSSLGKAYRLKVSSIKQGLNSEKGNALGAILKLEQGESILDFSVENSGKKVYFATKLGKVKLLETKLVDGTTQNLKGSSVIKLTEGDSIEYLKVVDDADKYATLATSDNRRLCFNLSQLSTSGKASSGRKGISLSDGCTLTNAKLCKEPVGVIASIGTRGKVLTG